MRKEHKIVVDGETYWVTRVDPFGAARLLALGRKMVGPLLHAFAKSGTIKGVFDEVVGRPGGFTEILDHELGPAFFETIGEVLDRFGDKIDAEDLIQLIRLTVIDHVAGPYGDQPKLYYEDDDTYLQAMSEQIDKHGHLHQIRLVWAVLRVNLGPISAGSPTTHRKDEAVPAPH